MLYQRNKCKAFLLAMVVNVVVIWAWVIGLHSLKNTWLHGWSKRQVCFFKLTILNRSFFSKSYKIMPWKFPIVFFVAYFGTQTSLTSHKKYSVLKLERPKHHPWGTLILTTVHKTGEGKSQRKTIFYKVRVVCGPNKPQKTRN